MTQSAPHHVSTLPAFSNQHGGCPRCGTRGNIWVIFDRGCAQVVGGDHYHRRCNCGHRWVEQTSEQTR